MSEDQNNNVAEESAQANVEANLQDDSQSNESPQSSEAQQSKRNDADHNWAEMRNQMRDKERQLEEMNRKISELSAPPTNQDDDYGVNDDDLIEGKHYKMLAKEIKSLKKDLRTKDAATAEDRVRMHYSDYNSVVTTENIELLKKQKPMLAKSIAGTQDPYEQAVAAYESLKEINRGDLSAGFEKKQAEENSQKPRSVNAISQTSPMADVNQFAQMDSSSRKAFLKAKFNEMQEAIKAG